MNWKRCVLTLVVTLLTGHHCAAVRAAAQTAPLDSLVARALAVSPDVTTARHRAAAARARVAPAGALPDPMLGVGVMNFPVSEPGFGDFMTMATIAASQTLPYPGKLPLARRAQELEMEAAEARVAAAELDAAAEVRKGYYELAFLDRTLALLESTQSVLLTLHQAAESRYAVGAGGQVDVLRALLDATRPPERAIMASEARRAALARLNAWLDRPGDTPVEAPCIPERIARAAAPDPSSVSFTSAALGARASGSPVPSLAELQERALRGSPSQRAHAAAVAAQEARVELARKAPLPDFDVSLQLGIRANNSDMVTFMVSAPVPLRRAQRQDERLAEARADLSALESEHRSMTNELLSEVARVHAELERSRAQLALFAAAVLPQGRAALEAATAAFQVGRADFQTVLESRSTLFEYELAYERALTDFAGSVAELERLLGAEVLP